ncbi:malonate decarboxylase, epsilon subunit [Salmonella enterica subsp. arizonae]|nr:malonate decarboxylase, epsilon subunit [Salmonella enterica subsp. arizonae]
MKILFTFPGQGTQHPDMLQNLPGPELAQAREVLGAEADGLDSPDALKHTRAVQLALLIAGGGLGAGAGASRCRAGYRQWTVHWRVSCGGSGRGARF